MATFELTVRRAVQGYHVYKDTWMPTIGKEFVCSQEIPMNMAQHTCRSCVQRWRQGTWTPSMGIFTRCIPLLGSWWQLLVGSQEEDDTVAKEEEWRFHAKTCH